MTYWCLMIRFANLLQAPKVSIYQLVKTITFVLYLFDMEEMNKMEMEMENEDIFYKYKQLSADLFTFTYGFL